MVCFLVNLNRRRVESKPEHCRARLSEDGQWVLKVFSLNQDLGFTDFVVQDFAIGRSQGLQIVQSHTAWRR